MELRGNPAACGDFEAKVIEPVLRQLSELFAVCNADDFMQTIESHPVHGEDDPRRPQYVGLPLPSELKWMRARTEKYRVLGYLLYAELGLLIVLAHASSGADKLASYREVDSKLAARFSAVLPLVANAQEFIDSEKSLLWVDDEEQREFFRNVLANIGRALKFTNLRNSRQLNSTTSSLTQGTGSQQGSAS